MILPLEHYVQHWIVCALKNRDLNNVKKHLKKHPHMKLYSFKFPDEGIYTLLEYAAFNGLNKFVKYFLKFQYDPPYMFTALTLALLHKEYQAAELLIQDGRACSTPQFAYNIKTLIGQVGKLHKSRLTKAFQPFNETALALYKPDEELAKKLALASASLGKELYIDAAAIIFSHCTSRTHPRVLSHLYKSYLSKLKEQGEIVRFTEERECDEATDLNSLANSFEKVKLAL